MATSMSTLTSPLLTPSERMVLDLLDHGCSQSMIGLALGVSYPGTRRRIRSARRTAKALEAFHASITSMPAEIRRLYASRPIVLLLMRHRRRGREFPLAKIHRLLLSGYPIRLIVRQTKIAKCHLIELRSALLAAGGPTADLIRALPQRRP